MWLKALNVVSQIIIIILALAIVVAVSKKQALDSTFANFEAQVNAKLDEDRKRFDDKVTLLQDSLNRYQLNREQRAQLFNERLDKLYELYNKDPSPLLNANSSKQVETVAVIKPPVLENNFVYLESKINNVSEKVDTENNKINSKLLILERRVEMIQSDRSSTQRIINTNIQTNNSK